MTQQDPWDGQFPNTPQPDPNQPLGPQPQPHVSIAQFQPEKSHLGTVILIGAVVLAVLTVLIGAWWTNQPKQPAESPTPTATTTPRPQPTGNGVPFETSQASGYWEVLEHEWVGDRLRARVRVSCTSGSLDFGFYAFSHKGTTTYSPELNGPDQFGEVTTVGTNEVAIGWVVFAGVPREPATLVLTSPTAQISALLLQP